MHDTIQSPSWEKLTRTKANETTNHRVLSIIIPVYNEEKSIITVLDRINEISLSACLEKEIIIINDCSTDQTDIVVKNYLRAYQSSNIQYFIHTENKGKGAAIRSGIHVATGDLLLIQDADLEYNPDDYNLLLDPILKGVADVVYGSRFMGGHPHRVLFFWHSIGNRILTFLSNVFTNLNLTDMETGYKLFKTSLLRRIVLNENRFGFEPEITSKISRIDGIRIYEVGISYYGRTYKEGKKINWRDAIRTIFCIVKYSLFVRQHKVSSKLPVKVITPSV